MFCRLFFCLMVFEEKNNGILLAVKVTPNAASLAVKGIFCDADGREYLKISVVSVPEKGKANKELIKFFSKELKLSKSEIELISGETNHLKKFLLKNKNQTVVEKIKLWSGAK